MRMLLLLTNHQSGSAIITPRLHAGSSMAPSSSRPVASRRRTDPSRSTTHRTDEPEDPSLAALMRHRATLTSRSARSASSSEIPTRSSSRRHAAAAPSTVPVSTEQTMPNVPPTSETQAMSNRPREETISSPYEPHLLPSSTSEPSPSSASSVPLPSSLATLIDANRAGPPDLAWDVRRDPRSSLYQWTYHGIFVPLTRHVHPELNQDATSPSINKLSIDSPLFLTGWEELAIESPSSITVWNILSALHDFLRKPLTHQEYAMIPRARRESLKQAFVSRVAHASQGLREREYSEGVRRVDYLMGQTSLIGFHLDSSGDGTCILQAAFASHDPEGVIPRPQPNRLAFTTPWYAPMPMMSPRYSPMPMPMTPIALTPRLFFGSAHHYN
ncbi:hypothetical protein SISNIDRAFT_312555 [Sistotremastrum niveocremeum HHB9708]|uniref:DUF6699 domain-containing protein n=2 Tax=Sistotremastraceae TaxID=3402574 RepID=A0A164XX84_9AGAM|nr:hypothetical protein SISNIDRAFT_312555 [Sistotremastrum niveocremeum HHB9708]KZT35325.1 hypothetical protein SISSUDRAFT_184013 [Sistotremastrum suecicum HHB10207 ss-3]